MEQQSSPRISDSSSLPTNPFQGVLWKRRDVFKNRWRPRWFVLDRGGILTYYLHDANSSVRYDVVPRGTIYLRECSVEEDLHLSRPSESLFAFTITPPAAASNGSPCFLAAASEQERNEWVEKLRQVCQVSVEEDGSSEESSEAAPAAAPEVPPATTAEPDEEQVDSWTDSDEDGAKELLVNVPEPLAARIESNLQKYVPLVSEFKPEHQWKTLFVNRHGVSAYERKLPNGRTMIKCTALLDHSPIQILNLLTDVTRRRDFETNIAQDARLQRYNGHTFLDYYSYRPVWPTSARDFCVAGHWRVLRKSSGSKAICVMGFSWSDQQLKPLVANHVRGDLTVSMYLLEAIMPEHKTRLSRVLSYDLGGNVPRSLTHTVLQQQAVMPYVICQHLCQTESTPDERLLGELDNKSIVSVISHFQTENGSSDALQQREAFVEQSATSGKSVVVDNKTLSGGDTTEGEPSLYVVAMSLLGPLFLWMASSLLHIPGKEVLFFFAAQVALRSVVLQKAGRPCVKMGPAAGLVGHVTCRFSVDLKGVLRFISNSKEERNETPNGSTHEVSVVDIVVKAVAQAMSEIEALSSTKVSLPVLGINGYFCPRKSGIDVSVAKHAGSSPTDTVVTIENASSMSIQEIADSLADKYQQPTNKASPSFMMGLVQSLMTLSLSDNKLGSCLVLATPDSDHCEVDLDAAPSPIHSGVNVTVVVGGVRLARDTTNNRQRTPPRVPARPVLSVSVTIDCPVCDITTCRHFSERVQKLVQFPEMCDD